MKTREAGREGKGRHGLFEAIGELHSLLDQEMESIKAGDIEAVVSLTSDKNDCILVINGLQEDIQENLEKGETEDLKEELQKLYGRLEENQSGLKAMIEAVQDIASSFERLEERRRDNGLYGRRGKKMRSLNEERESEIDGQI